MKRLAHSFTRFSRSLSLGFFLATRDVRRTNPWTTLLIIFVMMLTFLNLIVIQGILVGLIEGSVTANRTRYSSDVLIRTLTEKPYIEKSAALIDFIKAQPQVVAVTPRYVESGRLEAGYRNKIRATDITNFSGGLVAGINPDFENAVTGLSSYVIKGSYLTKSDFDQILIGKNLLYEYLPFDSPDLSTLKNVSVGSKVRLTIKGISREVTIKGILSSKVGEIDQRVFMNDWQLRQLIGRDDYNVDEIAIKLLPDADAGTMRDTIINSGIPFKATVQTWDQAQPKFLTDIKTAFAILGNIVGSIGLAVASITIFIVIFVNAVTRRKYIGILKGIGVDNKAIEISYILQAFFYAVVGTILGLIFIYGFLKPYMDVHPINFPFSDGILVATAAGVSIRTAILWIATIVAGYIPAKLIVRQNTLDAILGR